MGMFDYVTCFYELPLPENNRGYKGSNEFSTKSFENLLDQYKILEDGTLWVLKKEHVFDDKKNLKSTQTDWKFLEITDTVTIHHYVLNDDDQEYDYWISYEIVFIKGKVTEIKIKEFEAKSNINRKEKFKETMDYLSKRIKFEKSFIYKFFVKHYNELVHFFVRRLYILTNYISTNCWKLEDKLKF